MVKLVLNVALVCVNFKVGVSETAVSPCTVKCNSPLFQFVSNPDAAPEFLPYIDAYCEL